jgi:hypothetical protein
MSVLVVSLAKFCQKRKIWNLKFQKNKWIWKVFNRQKWEKNNKNHQIFIIGFSMCSSQKIYRRMTKDSYWIFGLNTQIWLNLPRDDSHFFKIFLWLITALTTNFFNS